MAKRHLGKTQKRSRANRALARANLLHARQLGFWTAEEAAAYSMGFAPRFLNRSTILGHLAQTRAAEEFMRRVDLIARALQIADIQEPIRPGVFVRWALECNLDLPEGLTRTSGLARDGLSGPAMVLEEELIELKARFDAQQRLLDEPHPRRIASMRTLIAGIAEGHYGFNSGSARNAATSAIKSDLSRAGRELDEATILDIVREAISTQRSD